MSYLPLLAAKKAGVPIRIAHSHNTSIDKDFKYILKQYLERRLQRQLIIIVHVVKKQENFISGKRIYIIPNAIEVDKFCIMKK